MPAGGRVAVAGRSSGVQRRSARRSSARQASEVAVVAVEADDCRENSPSGRATQRRRRYDRTAMSELIEMTVDSIRVHMPTGQHVVILKEKDAERYLPIWIGINEANAIALRITGITPERPITHDLLVNVLSATDVHVERVVVTSLSNDVFYARILAHTDGRTLDIDARPSDAIAIAVRVGAQIFVAAEVLDKAGVLPEAEKEETGEKSEEVEINEEKLAIFREMVNSMDLPDLDEPRGRSPES